MRLSRADSFDTVVEIIEEVMPIIYENCVRSWQEELGVMANVDLILAGWSAARNRPEAYLIHSAPNFCRTEEHAAELLADGGAINPGSFKLQELTGGVVFAPMVLYEKRAEAGFDEDLNERDYPAVLDGMRKLLELQRREIVAWDAEFYPVGGYATIATVTKDGVEQRVFHRWEEDKIGEFIQPGPLDLGTSNVIQIATPPAGMNRQQRRAWERQQKKRGGK